MYRVQEFDGEYCLDHQPLWNNFYHTKMEALHAATGRYVSVKNGEDQPFDVKLVDTSNYYVIVDYVTDCDECDEVPAVFLIWCGVLYTENTEELLEMMYKLFGEV